MSEAAPSLEGLVNCYRRAQRDTGTHAELEIRFHNIARGTFEAIFRALLKHGPGVMTRSVNTIMKAGEGPQRRLLTSRIREMAFEGTRRVSERYTQKTPLALPIRQKSSGGVSYSVALAAEAPGEPFTATEESLIRVKARTSFALSADEAEAKAEANDWRVDLTISREFAGSAVDGLKAAKDQMFAPSTPEALLAWAAKRGDCRYEVEVEFVAEGAARDAIRPGGISAAAEAVLRHADPGVERALALQAEIYHAAGYIIRAPAYRRRFVQELGLRRLLPAALAFTRAEYREIYPPAGFWVTPKADGTRALGIARGGQGRVAADVLHVFGAGPSRGDTILDGEFTSTGVFFAFDAISVAGEDVSAQPFEKRHALLAAGVAQLCAVGIPARVKDYGQIIDPSPLGISKVIRAIHDASREYAADGLVLVEPGRPYADTRSYKWKPATHNTLDALVRRAPAVALGRAPFVDNPGSRLHFLFVGIDPDQLRALAIEPCPGYSALFPERAGSLMPIQFAPSSTPLAYLFQHAGDDLDGKVVELRITGMRDGLVDWEVVRVRTDRQTEVEAHSYFGNTMQTAELTWLNYIDPFPLEQLWDGPGADYFREAKSDIYHAQTAALSFAKTRQIAALRGADVIDLGAGKGQDLGRYLDAGVRRLLAVDSDRAALSTLVRRKYDFAKKKQGTRTHVQMLVADLNAPHAQTLAKFAALGFADAGAVVCNLAAHYFIRDMPAMRNFAAVVAGVLRPGGTASLTVMDGAALHAALRGIPEGGTWDLSEPVAPGAPAVRKFSLKRLYASDTLEACGQRIGVLLPFSAGEYYEESLVNVDTLCSEFAARGLARTSSASVAERLKAFGKDNANLAAKLTDIDRQYLGLFRELVFQRS